MTPEINESVIDLFQHRKSVPLTPHNAKFFRSPGGLVSMNLINADGSVETFERIVIIRAFPITNPDDFLAIRETGSGGGRGDEIGLIESIRDFDPETVALLNEELDRRYFIPEITKIYSMKEKYGYHYTEAQTSAGRVKFVLNNPSNNIRTLEDGRILITDTDGNCFCLPDPSKLDKQSYRIIEIYL